MGLRIPDFKTRDSGFNMQNLPGFRISKAVRNPDCLNYMGCWGGGGMAEFLTSLANQYSVTGGHRFLMSVTMFERAPPFKVRYELALDKKIA